MSIVACSVDFIPVRVVDKSTGWLNKSALKVVQVSVKGAGTDEDTWYEDNKGQVGCIHFDTVLSLIKAPSFYFFNHSSTRASIGDRASIRDRASIFSTHPQHQDTIFSHTRIKIYQWYCHRINGIGTTSCYVHVPVVCRYCKKHKQCVSDNGASEWEKATKQNEKSVHKTLNVLSVTHANLCAKMVRTVIRVRAYALPRDSPQRIKLQYKRCASIGDCAFNFST